MNKHRYRVVYHRNTGTATAVAETIRSLLSFRLGTALTRLALNIVLSFCIISLAHAQSGGIQADPHADGQHRPVIDNTANGLPLVQIAAPDSHGLSHNQYRQFNVDPSGAILNNASDNVQTQLGGWVGGNPHLLDGGARTILNEITSANSSDLRGYLEVAGQQAEVIIANPNGITCNGCGFINSSRGVLTTGLPVFGGSGSLEAFRVTRGALHIGPGGFNDNATAQVDLIARSVQVNAALHANALNVISGANQVDYASLGVQIIEGRGAVPTVAIDVAALGGMYANKIRLIGTEAGVGVATYGKMASAGDFEIDAAGHLTLTGSVSSGGTLHLASDDRIVNQATLSAGGDLELQAVNDIDNQGQQLLAGHDLRLASSSLDNHGGTINANGNLNLNLHSDYTHAQDDHLDAGGDLHLITSGDFHNHDSISAGGELQVQATNIDNQQQALLSAGQATVLQAEQDLTNTGRIYGEDIAISAHTLSNGLLTDDGQPAAVIAARHRLDIGVAELVNREHAQLISAGDMAIGGSLDSDLHASGSATRIINSSATIVSDGDLRIVSTDLLNTNAHFASELQLDPSQTRHWTEYERDGSPQIYSTEEAGIRNEDDIDKLVIFAQRSRHNDYTKRQIKETTSRTVVTQTDPAQILARGDMLLLGGEVHNDKSAIVAGGMLTGLIEGLDNGGSNPQGEIHVHRDILSTHHTTKKCAGGFRRCNQEDTRRLQVDLPVEHFDLGIWRADAHSTPAHTDNPAQNKLPEFSWLPDSALYQVVSTPAVGYLIATDPAYTNYRNFLSSDYQLGRLGFDPQTIQKRLGDGYYEQRLINDQLLQRTGRTTLGAYASNEAQYQALLDAGVTYARQFDMVPGMNLSAAQMAALTSDMVWLEARTVTLADGSTQQVLAPQLYLHHRPEFELKPTGALLAAAQLDLQLQGRLDNAGTIRSDGNLRIQAEQDINNRLGSMTGGDVLLSAGRDINHASGSISGNQVGLLAMRDINIATLANTSSNSAGTQIGLDRTSEVHATTLIAQAQRDINLDAAVITSTGDTALVAGHDLNLNAVTTQSELNVTYDEQNHLYQRQEQVNGSTISTGGNTTLVAGQDIHSQAAYVNAGKELSAEAGGAIRLDAATQDSDYDQEVHLANSSGLSSYRMHSQDRQHSTQSVGTTFSGDMVTLQAGQDLHVIGSNVVATHDIALAAAGNVNVIASEDTFSQTYKKEEKTSGVFSGGGIGVTVGSRTLENAQTSRQVSHNASTVGSTDGQLTIAAGQTYTQTGSDLLTPHGDMSIAAKRIDIDAAIDTFDATQDTRFRQSGLTLQVTSPVLSAIQTVQQMQQAASQTKDGRMQALAGATAGLAAVNAAEAVMQNPATAGGINISASLGTSQSRSHSEQHSSTAQGSTLAAGGDISLSASGDGNNSDLRIVGSQITAAKDIHLHAEHDLTLLAAANTNEQHSSNSGSSASVGVSYGTDGLMINASASGSRGRGDGNDVTYSNTHITAGQQLTTSSGNDTHLQGAVAGAEQVTITAGGDLNIESLQDSSHYDSKQQSFGGSISAGAGRVSGNINASRSKVNANYVSVQEQSGIQAGDGGFSVTVGGNTDLIGSQIASSEQAVQEGRNSFSSGSLTLRELHNQSEYHAESQSVSVGVGGPGTSGGIGGSEGSQQSTTYASISGGQIILDDAAQQTKTGQSADEVLATLDRSALTGKDSSNSLVKDWDGQELQADVTAQAQIMQAFGQQAAKAIGDYAGNKYASLITEAKIARSNGDTARAEQLTAEAANWDEGGAYRIALHTAAGALGGGVGGALGAAVSSSAMPEIAKAIDGMGLPEVVQKGLEQVVATALGAAVGGAAGAVSGVNVEANNRQLHQSEKELIAKKANGNKDTEERLTKAACYAVQCWAEYPEDSKEHSEKYVSVMDIYDLKNEMAWIKEQQEKGTFVYTPIQETVDYIKNDLKTNVLPVASNSLKMVTGGLSAALGTTLCWTTGAGCISGGPMIFFGLGNLTEGGTGLYAQYYGNGSMGYNPMKYGFNQALPGNLGSALYTGIDFGIGILSMRAQVPLNVGLADGLGRPTSIFGVTVPRINNSMLLPFTKMPLPYGTTAVVTTTGVVVKGGEFANEIYKVGNNE